MVKDLREGEDPGTHRHSEFVGTATPSRYLAVKPGQMPIHFRELTISETDELIAQEFLIYELKDIT